MHTEYVLTCFTIASFVGGVYIDHPMSIVIASFLFSDAAVELHVKETVTTRRAKQVNC